jgi:hypothetical protein
LGIDISIIFFHDLGAWGGLFVLGFLLSFHFLCMELVSSHFCSAFPHKNFHHCNNSNTLMTRPRWAAEDLFPVLAVSVFLGFLLGRMTIYYPCLGDAAFPDGGFHRHGFVLFFGWISHLTCFLCFLLRWRISGILESEADGGEEVEKEI